MREPRFYRIKEICMDFHISTTTLRRHIKDGKLPALEQPYPMNTKYIGYSETTFRVILDRLVQSLQSDESGEQ